MKILLNLINNLDNLWCRVLRSKYGRGKDLTVNISVQPYEFLMNNLPDDTVSRVLALPTPTDDNGLDTIGWSGTNTHQFTVQSAYSLQHQNCLTVEGDWKILWQWHDPRRVQTFIWLAIHGRILTNLRRSRWGVGISPTSPCCGNDDETVLHVLCDCIHATQVWLHIVPSNFKTNFFSFDCRDWFFNNLNSKKVGMADHLHDYVLVFVEMEEQNYL